MGHFLCRMNDQVIQQRFFLINPYKRQDVFSCRYSSHARFSYRVSAYHVLKEKQCFPQGCIYFKWSCRLLEKGKSCVRKYHYVGRLCDGCRYYEDEKVHLQPALLLTAAEYERFLSQIQEFDDWIESLTGREVEFYCQIDSVKPRFRKEVMGRKNYFRLNGYVLVVRQGFIDRESFEDIFYIDIAPAQQERYRFASGDCFEAKGRVSIDRGRVLIGRTNRIEFEERSQQPTWKNSEALVARQVATLFVHQPEPCLKCPKGALVDVSETVHGVEQKRRELYCLAGIVDPRACYLFPHEKMAECIFADRALINS